MSYWERNTTRVLNSVGLKSIRSKIIGFALVATLIPSLTMGWLSYENNRRLMSEKLTQELESVTSHASREIDLWLKERLYEIRVFSSSYVVSENLEKLASGRSSAGVKKTALRRSRDYLNSVKEKFVDYAELMVLGAGGQVVASSFGDASDVKLPDGWRKLALAGDPILGTPILDASHGIGVITIAAPIFSTQQRLLGLLAAKLNFRTVQDILVRYAAREPLALSVITPAGGLLATSLPTQPEFLSAGLPGKTAQRIMSNEGRILEYRNTAGTPVLGALHKVPHVQWGVVAAMEKATAYAEIFRMRNVTGGIILGTLVLVGLLAYLLGLTIVLPLNRLTDGAQKVASGDLDVDLPVVGEGELGLMTRIFNQMVGRIRRGRDDLAAINAQLSERNIELEEISSTDGLTGLFNRKHLNETLATEIARSRRKQHQFGLLMLDIDHFKQYNDTFGHLAGDDVLRKMASLFHGSIRECDYAARYGGEEFLILLPETDADAAVQAAERIREKVGAEMVDSAEGGVSITVSVGISIFPVHGDEPEALIQQADTALYEAKNTGRNRVVLAGEDSLNGQMGDSLNG